jgi:heme/copper-type cytochrome/quinol oxidase subunit 4
MGREVIWSSLTTPDQFKRDWYGWATNQLGHIMIGLALACALTLLYFWAAGEFPYKTHLFAVIGCVCGAHLQRNDLWKFLG